MHVKKSFHGIVKLNDNLCPEDCVVCVDICPTHAIVRKNNKIKIDSEFCIFCSACKKICPQNALNVSRNWIDHDEIKSAPWLTTLKKLTSFKTLRKELSIKSTKKRSVVRSHGHQPTCSPTPGLVIQYS